MDCSQGLVTVLLPVWLMNSDENARSMAQHCLPAVVHLLPNELTDCKIRIRWQSCHVIVLASRASIISVTLLTSYTYYTFTASLGKLVCLGHRIGLPSPADCIQVSLVLNPALPLNFCNYSSLQNIIGSYIIVCLQSVLPVSYYWNTVSIYQLNMPKRPILACKPGASGILGTRGPHISWAHTHF